MRGHPSGPASGMMSRCVDAWTGRPGSRQAPATTNVGLKWVSWPGWHCRADGAASCHVDKTCSLACGSSMASTSVSQVPNAALWRTTSFGCRSKSKLWNAGTPDPNISTPCSTAAQTLACIRTVGRDRDSHEGDGFKGEDGIINAVRAVAGW